MKFENFDIKCKKCNSSDVDWVLNAYDSCCKYGIKCNGCDMEESEWG